MVICMATPTYSAEVCRWELVNGTYKIKWFDREVASKIVDVIVDVICTEDNLGGTEINIRRNRRIFYHLILVSTRWAETRIR